MMYKKDLSYRGIPFSRETPQEDFFLYDTISNIYTKCEINKNKIIKIRTLGILRNNHGCFYIKEMITTHNPSIVPNPKQSIRVSLAYMSRPVRCSSMPYPVQLFGRLQWCDRPVIFAQIMQPVSVSVAMLLHETMARVKTLQTSSHPVDSNEPDN